MLSPYFLCSFTPWPPLFWVICRKQKGRCWEIFWTCEKDISDIPGRFISFLIPPNQRQILGKRRSVPSNGDNHMAVMKTILSCPLPSILLNKKWWTDARQRHTRAVILWGSSMFNIYELQAHSSKRKYRTACLIFLIDPPSKGAMILVLVGEYTHAFRKQLD